MSIRIYVEGGFGGASINNCRKAFRLLFEKVIPRGAFRVVASGDRRRAYDDFCLALRTYPNDDVILLVDAEEDINVDPWLHFAQREGDRWVRPANAEDDSAHVMAQVMETWFLADAQALSDYYGQHFNLRALPRRVDVEHVSKRDVYLALANATNRTKKGEYHKTRHAFELVERIDPGTVRAACPYANRLLVALELKASERLEIAKKR